MSTAVAKVPSLSELATDINRNHELAVMYAGQSFDHAVRAGLLLIEAEEQVKHGEWLSWLKANVKVGARQASNYMRVAAAPGEIRSGVADLSLRKAIHELAGRSRCSINQLPTCCGPLKGELRAVEPDEPDEPDAAAAAKKLGVSKREVERIWAEADEPKAKPVVTALDDARRYYARELAEFGNDEMALIQESIKLDKARKAAIRKKRASTLPQDGRSEDGRGDHSDLILETMQPNDIGDIPPELDRRRH